MPFKASSIAGAGCSLLAISEMRAADRRDSDHGVALGLDCLALSDQQLQPIEFAADLHLQMRRQWSAVAGPQLFEPRAPVAAQRLVAGYALAEQQALDAIDVAYALIRAKGSVTTI